MIREKQDGEDLVFFIQDRGYATQPVEALRINGATGKVTAATQLAGAFNLTEEWDKAAADGAAGTATGEHFIMRAASALTVKAVYFVPDAAVTANDTNYFTVTVSRRNADNTGQVTTASINAALTVAPFSGNWTSFVAVPLTLTTANLALLPGQILTVQITKTGTGLVCPAGRIVVVYQLT